MLQLDVMPRASVLSSLPALANDVLGRGLTSTVLAAKHAHGQRRLRL